MVSTVYTVNVFFFLLVMVETKFFKFEDCGQEESVFRVSAFTIDPDPVDMTKNMSISAQGVLFRDIPPSAVLETRYYRLRKVLGMQVEIPIPCIFGRFGSCTFPLCEYLKRFKSASCQFYPPERPCDCPVKAGIYGGQDVEVPFGDTSILTRFITKGKYRTEFRLKQNETDEELACFKIHTELK
ncbi:uncharacterized protein LOC129228154 [Uloborus diversus]|uniref:uncharacterized protein LOC129228154 n=1 Tax=Uloborus diversus TaxID=327109 RepID=UPI00240A33D1|nr:uncharacterized protein LOC129228154 [Uloborus diversus]